MRFDRGCGNVAEERFGLGVHDGEVRVVALEGGEEGLPEGGGGVGAQGGTGVEVFDYGATVFAGLVVGLVEGGCCRDVGRTQFAVGLPVSEGAGTLSLGGGVGILDVLCCVDQWVCWRE